MAISDAQFRLGVAAAGAVLVLSLTVVRFCGSVGIPPKPAASGPTGSSSQLAGRGVASPVVYQDFLEKDAAAAGVRVPSLKDMARKLPYRVDEARHVLEVGQPPIEIAGLRLSAQRAGRTFVLQVDNLTESALAYSVTTAPTPNISGCTSATATPFNALVIVKGGTERRVECVWREGMALAVTRVETVEISPLSAYYLSLVPPSLVGVEDRIARGHLAPESSEKCSTVVSQAVRSGLEKEQIGWRDLVDFYARHRCPTYRFPMSYRAFKSDGERPLPAVDASM